MLCRLVGLPLLLTLFSIGVEAQRDERNAPGISVQTGDTVKINDLVLQIASLRDTDPELAVKLCHEVISFAHQIDYRKGEGRATGSLGWIYFRRGDLVKAFEYSIEALKISEKIGDQFQSANSLNNIGAIEFEEKQFVKALANFMQALNLAKQSGDAKTIGRSLNNIAYTYLAAWNNTDSAQAYASKALRMSEMAGDPYSGSYANNTVGMVHVSKGELAKSLKFYFRSLALSEGVSNSLKVETWNQIAEVYLSQGYGLAAIPVLLKNIDLTRKHGYKESLARTYQLLSQAYQMQGNSIHALDYLQRYVSLHDSIYNEQASMKLATIQSKFDLDLKEAQIELLTKDTQLHKKEISQKRTQLYASIGGLLTILAIATLLFYANRKINQANGLLENQKKELANKNHEVELKSRELEIQTEELARLNATKDKLFSIIGHDFRSPINSLKGILELLENRNLSQGEFTAVAATLKANLDSVSTNLENLLQWSLAQLKGLQTNPVNISVPELVNENISLFGELAKAKNIQLENEISDSLFAFADEDHTRLVLRNLINNAIKFTSSGGVVKISSQPEGPFIKIRVSDTGIGIESNKLKSLFQKEKLPSTVGTNLEKGVGIGLMLCKEFVETNGGRLSVASEPGKGSVFSFTLKAA